MSIPLTKEYLLHLFDYDRNQGVLIWKNHWHYPTHCSIVKSIAGTVEYYKYNLKYIRVRIKGKAYNLHQLIYFLEKGIWVKVIDHIDGNGLNNKINNLRITTPRKNQQNRKSHRKGGLVGATYNKKENKWRSQISINGKKFSLGRFNTELEAHQRYLNILATRGLS